MRTLAVGDIHGCLTAFRAILSAVSVQPDDTLVTLGDYVDDGPDSSGVISKLLQLKRKCRLVPLIGNHEQMMLEARDSSSKMKEWLRCGGKATLKSYRRTEEFGKLEEVPQAHWRFLTEDCLNYFEIETHFFVHANAYPNMELSEQPEYMMRWEQINDCVPHNSGKVMVCGHTSQKSGNILNMGHAICIDTNAAGGGWLTCLDITSLKYWQANEAGVTRTGRI